MYHGIFGEKKQNKNKTLHDNGKTGNILNHPAVQERSSLKSMHHDVHKQRQSKNDHLNHLFDSDEKLLE